MAKEETKTPVVGQEKLTYEQLSAFSDRLEQEYKRVVNHAKNLEKELESYKINDYYNRAGLLFEIIKFTEATDHGHNFNQDFLGRVYQEFEELVSPEKRDEAAPKDTSPAPENAEE